MALAATKTMADLIESVRAALAESGVELLHLADGRFATVARDPGGGACQVEKFKTLVAAAEYWGPITKNVKLQAWLGNP